MILETIAELAGEIFLERAEQRFLPWFVRAIFFGAVIAFVYVLTAR